MPFASSPLAAPPAQPTARAESLSSLRSVEGPHSVRLLAVVLLALLGLTLAMLTIAPWQQNVAGVGRVVAFEPYDRIQTIAAPVDGRIRQAWVIEGSKVKQGDPLLEIVDNDPAILMRLEQQRSALLAQLDSAEQKVEVYRQQVTALEAAKRLAMEAAGSQVEVASAAVRSARFGLDAARAGLQQARLNFDRVRELEEEGLASELDHEIAERVFLEAKAKEDQAEQALGAAMNDELARKAQLGQVETEAQARIESARAQQQTAQVEVSEDRERLTQLEVRIAQQATQRITAPRDGTVFRLMGAPGAELVKAGDPLVQLVPDTGSRAVELWVDGNDVPLIRDGRNVRLQFEGWPAVQFSGWPSVAVGTFGGQVALVDQSDDGRGRFRLLVVPDPGDQPWPDPLFLRQGVRAKGFVLLDRVSLGYELWRQANGFPPTVAMQEPGAGGGSASTL